MNKRISVEDYLDNNIVMHLYNMISFILYSSIVSYIRDKRGFIYFFRKNV